MDHIDVLKKQYPLQLWADNTILRTTCKPVNKITKEIRKLAQALEFLVREYEWVGLAAPQIWENIRMAAITQWDMSKKKRELLEEVIMINPEVISKGEKTEIEEEGCLSLPGITGDVSRPTQITIKYQTIDGKQHIRKISGYNARIVQHEIDHLDGVLFIDKLA